MSFTCPKCNAEMLWDKVRGRYNCKACDTSFLWMGEKLIEVQKGVFDMKFPKELCFEPTRLDERTKIFPTKRSKRIMVVGIPLVSLISVLLVRGIKNAFEIGFFIAYFMGGAVILFAWWIDRPKCGLCGKRIWLLAFSVNFNHFKCLDKVY